MRQRYNDGPILTILEVIGNHVVPILFDLVVVVSVLDAAEVPRDHIRPCTGHDRLFFFIHASVEARRGKRDSLLHRSNVFGSQLQLDTLWLSQTVK